MSTRLTPARQRNAVSEGMALGLLLCGRSSVLHDKVRVDLAFEGAWRTWNYTPQFRKFPPTCGRAWMRFGR